MCARKWEAIHNAIAPPSTRTKYLFQCFIDAGSPSEVSPLKKRMSTYRAMIGVAVIPQNNPSTQVRPKPWRILTMYTAEKTIAILPTMSHIERIKQPAALS
jgi:hypothetical protein